MNVHNGTVVGDIAAAIVYFTFRNFFPLCRGVVAQFPARGLTYNVEAVTLSIVSVYIQFISIIIAIYYMCTKFAGLLAFMAGVANEVGHADFFRALGFQGSKNVQCGILILRSQ